MTYREAFAKGVRRAGFDEEAIQKMLALSVRGDHLQIPTGEEELHVRQAHDLAVEMLAEECKRRGLKPL